MQRLKIDVLEKVFTLIQYEPTPWQWQVHCSPERFRTVAAGARAGKSMAGGAEIAAYLLTMSDFHIWVVSSVYDLADKEFDWAYRFLCRVETPTGRIIDDAKVSMPGRGSKKISFPNGSFVETKSSDKLETLLGEELDFLIIAEAAQLPRIAWNTYLRERISSKNGFVLETSTPNSDGGVFAEHFRNGQPGGKNDWKSWQYSVLENKHFSREEYKLLKSELDEKNFDEQCDGKFVSRRGLVMHSFDRSRHVCKDLPTGSESWSVFRTIKRGYANPFSVIFIAWNLEKKEYWVYDEIYATQKTSLEIAPLIAKKSQGRRVSGTLIDFHDVAGKEELKALAVNCVSNDQEKNISKTQIIMKRLECLQNVFKVRDDGSVRIHIHERCTNLLHEIENCKWPDAQAEEAEKAESELPLTKYFQALQALSICTAFVETMLGYRVF